MRKRKPPPVPLPQAAILADLADRLAFEEPRGVPAAPHWNANALNRLLGRGWIVRAPAPANLWWLTEAGVAAELALHSREAADARA